MTFTFVDDGALGPILVMTTRRDTQKWRALTANPQGAVLVHDFGAEAAAPGGAAPRGTLAITLYGRVVMPTGASEDALRAAHLARNPDAANFIADNLSYALLAFQAEFVRMCNVKDEVSTWARAAEGVAAPAPALAPLKVAIGSTNATKIRAVTEAFAAAFPSRALSFTTHAVPSGVSAQPMGDEETRLGALNRASAAAAAAAAIAADGGAAAAPQHQPVDYAVGLEGGCGDDLDGALVCFAWMAVVPCGAAAAGSRESTARTATLRLPVAVADLVRAGVELGDADDRVFGRVGSKHKDGAVGLLTKGLIDRAAYYKHALILALAPFISGIN